MRFIQTLWGILSLITANLVPLFGIFFLGWSAAEIMLCFWVESLVVGIFTMLKLWQYRESDGFYLGFFPAHYGIFMFVHLTFLLVGTSSGLFGFAPFQGDLTPFLINIGIFFLATLFSHGVSYFANFRGKEEYKKHSATYYVFLPYIRIIPMHIAITLSATFGAGPLILYSMKLLFDLGGHVLEHYQT